LKNKHIFLKSIQTEKAEESLKRELMYDIIVHFIVQKLKNKHIFLKSIQTEKVNFSCRDIPQLSQFVYFLRQISLFFNFWMMNYVLFDIINTLSSKIYKLRKLRNLSFWQNERREKPNISHHSLCIVGYSWEIHSIQMYKVSCAKGIMHILTRYFCFFPLFLWIKVLHPKY